MNLIKRNVCLCGLTFTGATQNAVTIWYIWEDVILRFLTAKSKGYPTKKIGWPRGKISKNHAPIRGSAQSRILLSYSCFWKKAAFLRKCPPQKFLGPVLIGIIARYPGWSATLRQVNMTLSKIELGLIVLFSTTRLWNHHCGYTRNYLWHLLLYPWTYSTWSTTEALHRRKRSVFIVFNFIDSCIDFASIFFSLCLYVLYTTIKGFKNYG